jgi:long-chain acyl-CoA synthetase
VAALLTAHGVNAGDRVGVMAPNVPEFAVIYFGVLRAGGVVVPMNPLLKAREIEFYLGDSGARLVFAWHTAADEVDAAAKRLPGVEAVAVIPSAFLAELLSYEPSEVRVERSSDDTAVILYTSGTTGRPKGAELTHGNLISNAEVTQSDLLHLDGDDVVFGGLPLFHSFGQTVTLNTTVAAGASLVMLPRFDPRAALGLMAEHQVTVFAGVPTMYSAFLTVSDAPELPRLRVCISGGAALPVEVLRQFEDRFGSVILEGYGLSETSPVASFNRPDARRSGSIGTPVSGVEIQVVDADGNPLPDGAVGEIAIRGHNVMKGYWRRPDATADVLSEDGWFRTGDVGRRDDDGFYVIVDRMKDLIIRGGFNIYPREIEEVLYEHPDVAEAAVIGIPHDQLGEEVGAAVALRAGSTTTETELREYVRSQVAAYKYPRVVWFVDALPKGPTGKILKREILAPTPLTEAGTR